MRMSETSTYIIIGSGKPNYVKCFRNISGGFVALASCRTFLMFSERRVFWAKVLWGFEHLLIGVEYFLQGCLAPLKTEALTVPFLGQYNVVQNFSIL